MAKNSAVNLDITNNADGYDVSGGTTVRKLTLTGADITLTGSGSAVLTFPSTTDTIVGRDTTDTLTNKTIDADNNTISNLAIGAEVSATVSTDLIIANNNGLIIGSATQITTDGTMELQVLGTGGDDSGMILARFSDNLNQPQIEFVKSRNATIGGHTIVQDNDALGGLHWHADDGVAYDTSVARFIAQVDDASPAVDDIGTEFIWSAMPGGGGGIRTVLQITAAGDMNVKAGGLTVNGSEFILEQASADGDVATYGQIWIKSDAPNALMFTDDTGIDYSISKSSIRWLTFNLVEAATDVAVATNIAGDFVSPIAGTILQSDSSPFYIYATNSTAGITGTTVVDISIGGTSIMTTNKLDFDTTEKTTTTAATPPDLTTTALAVGDIITIDVDSIASGTAPKGLTVYMAIRE